MIAITNLLKFRNHFKELNRLAPSATPHLLQVKSKVHSNACILRLNFLGDLAKGAKALHPGYATDCDLKILSGL